jgi:Antitoxin component of bacterial toxin-antitoxin system, MqsA
LHDGVKSGSQSYKGRLFETDNRGSFCDHCEDGFLEFDAEQEMAWFAFRNQVDALEAAELVRIRKRLKLIQMQAGVLAGGVNGCEETLFSGFKQRFCFS